MQKHSPHHAKTGNKKAPQRKLQQQAKKNKIGLFYKINLSLLLIVFLALSYFLILVSTNPKSIPFVTQKIETTLKEKFGNDVSLSQSYISFTRYGTLQVAVSDLKIFYTLPDSQQKQAFVVPRLESEFSLFNLLLGRFQPSKIKIINPTIVVDTLQKLTGQPDQKSNFQTGDMSLIIKLLSSVKTGALPIKDFEIENANLLIKSQEYETKILLKKSQIRTSVKDKILYFSSINKASFDEEKADVDFNSSCQLSKQDGLKCDLSLINFVADSIGDLHPSLSTLNQINATLNATASFVIKNNQLGNILFKAEAKDGDFEFVEFFGQKIDFSNLTVIGEYDNAAGVLNLSQIKADLVEANQNLINIAATKPHLEMSLLISGLKNLPQQKLDFYIKLKDVPNDEMEKFWPAALSHNNVRTWVISHIKNGVVKDAYTRFSIIKKAQETHLENIEAQVVFDGFNLEYSSDFPAINNVSGVAKFSKQGMKISLNSGDVLNSKISQGLVEIKNFHAPQVLLEISGKSQGNAADSLKHANNQPNFATQIEKYLNGNSQNDFDIRIPLHDKITLKDSYIAINSSVAQLKNEYVKGDVAIQVKKDFASEDFISSINLTNASLVAKAFDIEKKSGSAGGLELIVAIENSKKIRLKNIELWKKEAVVAQNLKKNSAINLAKISAEVEFEIAPFLLTKIDLKNSNFGKNNYAFSYKIDKAKALQKISIKGQQLNLASFIEQKFFLKIPEEKKPLNSQVEVAVNNISLLRSKSLKNFYLFLNCQNNFCKQLVAKSNYGKKQFIDFNTLKSKNSEVQNNVVVIEGRISDVGYLAEAFGISNTVSAGDAKIKMQNKIIDKKPFLEGSIVVNNSITIYENATTKRLASNNLFSQVKDKIFSSQKIIFDSLKLEFSTQGSTLNLKSLIANNYKIGITAKGTIDLKNNIYNIKGMIVPGFIINNLFGIGNIPILGNVVGLLTGGEGGGLFGIRYEYVKKQGDRDATFTTNKISSFVPTTIKSLFDLI